MSDPTTSIPNARTSCSVIGCLLLVFVIITPVQASNGIRERPNIVIIISDDQAWTDYGFMGHADIKTPYLDGLAARSLVFERGYVASPLCRPSLASILTGLYPFQHGITGNDVDGKNQRAELDLPLRAKFHRHPSFVNLLTQNGYLTHQSGKWWEGSWKDGGFTHGMTHGDPTRGGRHGDRGLKIGRDSMKPVTDFIDNAMKEQKPFLLWYAPFLPHSPHNPPKRFLENYRRPELANDVAEYYAMCEWFDETCGQLLNHLDDSGLTENTLVIYICDNGWRAASMNANDPHQELWQRYALRSKGSPYENGIRTPIMISWPAKLQPRRVNNLAHAIDVLPTIAAASGFESPDGLAGINLMDEKARSKRNAVFGVCNAIQDISLDDPDETLQYLWCISDGWKLLLRHAGKDTTMYRKLHVWDDKPLRLYNISLDPNEANDVSEEHPEIAKRLRRKIEAWHSVQKKGQDDARNLR